VIFSRAVRVPWRQARARVVSDAPAIPLGLYLHFPWCVSKCPYCDFNSYTLREPLGERAYVDALLLDVETQLELRGDFISDRPITTVFMGGGTPSLFSPESIGRVLDRIKEIHPVLVDAEITLEANPATVERGLFTGYAAAGINRISLGAQTFDREALRRLGRIHVPEDVHRSASELHAAGIDNFNIDLMYGLPEQSVEGAMRDLDEAMALQPAQVSHYHLTLEAGTPFAAQPPANLPSDETVEITLQAALERLERRGYHQYEVSAHAQRGRECAHNLLYWRFGDYIGAGAGAHGKLSRINPDTGELEILRSHQTREPRRYQRDPRGAITWAAVPLEQRPFEYMLNALRLVEGFDKVGFESTTGLRYVAIEPVVAKLQGRGLLEAAGVGRWRTSVVGRRFLNDILVEFLPPKP
jgi:putative oxygen-independent coproporphyrinogen III oxidase